MKLVKIKTTTMNDCLYITVDDTEIVGNGRVIIKKSCPLSKQDIVIFEVIPEDMMLVEKSEYDELKDWLSHYKKEELALEENDKIVISRKEYEELMYFRDNPER